MFITAHASRMSTWSFRPSGCDVTDGRESVEGGMIQYAFHCCRRSDSSGAELHLLGGARNMWSRVMCRRLDVIYGEPVERLQHTKSKESLRY